MNWKAGDIAVCIDTKNSIKGKRPLPLRVNIEYVVQSVIVCECGEVKLDIGIYTQNGTECNCGYATSRKEGIWWFKARRFKKKEYVSEILKKAFSYEEMD